MDIIVWGTGRLFQRFKEYLFKVNIIKFCDSDKKKQGDNIDGIEIISPDEIVKYEYSYIAIMTYETSDIYQSLIEMQVPDSKILLHSQIFLLQNKQMSVQSHKGKILFDEWKKKNNNAILLLSHQFSYSGVPVALKNMALSIRDMGYPVLMAAGEGGSFIKELRILGLDYIENVDICYGTECFREMLSHFSVIIVGTFALYRVVETWEKINVPILWWIHETHEKFYEGKGVLPTNSNIRYLAGGNRVKRIFREHYFNTEIEKLQYYIPDTRREHNENHNLVITVAAIGAIDPRKGQDILLEAIQMLPKEYICKFKFVIVGKVTCEDLAFINIIENAKTVLSQIEWIEELQQDELDSCYEDIDVLICASRDDPMPVVVTQAMMHEKTCIVSDEVGQAEFIINRENGLIFKSEDRKSLKEELMWVVDHRECLSMIGKKSREIYDKEFSEEVMKEKLSAIFQRVIYEDD